MGLALYHVRFVQKCRVKSGHSRKQGLLGTMMARSFATELKRIKVWKTLGCGRSYLLVEQNLQIIIL